jgi:hypothetical protein
VVPFTRHYAGFDCGDARLPTRVVSAPDRYSRCVIPVAARSVHKWCVRTVGRGGISSRGVGPPSTHNPYGAASAPDDSSGSINSAGSPANRFAEQLPSSRCE